MLAYYLMSSQHLFSECLFYVLGRFGDIVLINPGFKLVIRYILLVVDSIGARPWHAAVHKWKAVCFSPCVHILSFVWVCVLHIGLCQTVGS